MPAFNAEKFIAQAIESILSQTWQNWELLICNDSSSDKTASILTQYKDSRIKLFSNEINEGYLRTCNRLFALSSGEFITFQDADDYSSPDRICKLLRTIRSTSTIGMVGSNAVIMNEDGHFLRNDERVLNHKLILQNLTKSSQFNGATVLIRRRVLEQIGGYREYFNEFAYQDYDWTCRIAERFVSINIPDLVYYYRQHGSSNSKRISTKRAISKRLVIWLAQDRKLNKTDYLERGEVGKVDKFVKDNLLPYQLDPSLIYREYAANYLYSGLFKKAVKTSMLAIIFQPFNIINYRTFFYCVRKSLLK